MVGHKTVSIYRRYSIVEEAMLRDAADKLGQLARSEARAWSVQLAGPE
jgi:hypothetical protein